MYHCSVCPPGNWCNWLEYYCKDCRADYLVWGGGTDFVCIGNQERCIKQHNKKASKILDRFEYYRTLNLLHPPDAIDRHIQDKLIKHLKVANRIHVISKAE
jgi:hypothetical protein